MPFNLSTGELLVLAIVAVIIFGGRLPEVARRVGRSVSEFRRGVGDEMRRMDLDRPPDVAAPGPAATLKEVPKPAPSDRGDAAPPEPEPGED